MWSPEASEYLDSIRSAGRHPIKDEFTDLDIDRRFKWQKRKQKKGRCVRCGGKMTGKIKRGGETKNYCKPCAELRRGEVREYHRKKFGWKPRAKK